MKRVNIHEVKEIMRDVLRHTPITSISEGELDMLLEAVAEGILQALERWEHEYQREIERRP